MKGGTIRHVGYRVDNGGGDDDDDDDTVDDGTHPRTSQFDAAMIAPFARAIQGGGLLRGRSRLAQFAPTI